MELRPGESTVITGILKSTTGFVPNVTKFTPDENNSAIKIRSQGKSYQSSDGIEPATFYVSVPDKIQPGEYTIPIFSTLSTGSAMPSEFISVDRFRSSSTTFGYVVAATNMTINVLQPLTFSQWFKEGWEVYGDLISLVAGGFVAGFSALVIDKLKERHKHKEQEDNKRDMKP